MIEIAPRYLMIILEILKKHIPYDEVRAFGSRINGHAKEYSDLDMVIIGKAKLPGKILYTMREEFEESDLPFRVEIMDWQVLSDDFKKIITAQYEVLQPAQALKRR